ncbi:MAG: PKD domain-containing protein [Bacteroidales bacterium]|nr:PKD domain-containing protein [Bacteroidales bacterium]
MLKNYFAFSCLLVCLISMAPAIAQDVNSDSLFGERGELYFDFSVQSEKEIHELSGIISLDKVEGLSVRANANQKEFEVFLEMGIPFVISDPPTQGFDPVMKKDIVVDEIKAWDFYPTYEGYVSMMYQFQALYPQLCQVFSIGQSVQGRELLVARISDNAGTDENEPEFLYTSSIHGDELTAYVLMLRLIDYLLTNYGVNPRITGFVDHLEIYINPLANPDGTYAGGNNTVSGATRRNANYVDLNRNYPDPEDGPHPDGYAWQPETVAFMNFAENRDFVSGANFHGGAEVCNYPWDTWPTLAADDDWWILVCNEYADTAQYYSPPGYLDDFGTGITNGYQWYTISGGRQDYMNYFRQCREFTMEISSVKTPPANQLNAFWGYNYRSFLNFIGQTLYGVQGTVTDSVTGQPLLAEIYVLNHEADSSWVYSSLPAGNYCRLLHQGTYNIRYSAPGYFPKTIENVQVMNHQPVFLDVELVAATLIADFTASATSVPVGASVDFTDLSFGNPVSWQWTFEGGVPGTSSQQNPSNIVYPQAGTFNVSLTVSNGTVSHTTVKTGYITVSEELIMSNNTITTCSGTFYDSGGPSGNYSNYEDFVMTIFPAAVNGKITAVFTSFHLEYHSNCNYDWLKIYNGNNTSAPLLGTFCGTNSPGTIVASGASGSLTFSFHSDYSVTEPGWSALISCQADPVALNLKVLLQGPFNGTGMNVSLQGNPSFPLTQPYNTPPWNYTGAEAVAFIPNNQIVDWILVELRDAASLQEAVPSTVIGRKACFVLADGSVTDPDGVSLPEFMEPWYSGLFCAIWHRNHIGIISANSLQQSGGLYSYDFTTGAGQVAGGVNGYRQLVPGIWGMAGGDGNADGQVNNVDKNDVWAPSAGQGGYMCGDFNLDVQVNNGDKNDIWVPNTGLGCQVPE